MSDRLTANLSVFRTNVNNYQVRSENNTAATDYTIQVSVMFLGGIAATILSGVLAKATGYAFVFAVCTAVSLLSVLFIPSCYSQEIHG